MAYKRSKNGLTVRFFLFHPATWFLVATLTMIVTSKVLWEKHRSKIVSGERYVVGENSIQITNPPEWFGDMLSFEVDNFESNQYSLLDTELVPNSQRYFSAIPWVKSVKQIDKTPNGLHVDLEYRKPAAMVCAKNQDPITVDSEGKTFETSVLTKSELASLERSLMKIYVFRPVLSPIVAWHYFPDQRIQEGAALVDFVQKRNGDFDLHYAVTEDLPGKQRKSHWELWTQNGTRIVWGSAPGLESESESNPAKKIDAIQQFVTEYGTLVEFDEKENLKIDVSSGKAILVKASRTADSGDWIHSIK